ncbi:Acetyl-coenzyme A synthetase [Aphelenchoides besseyi]|nr:Acetyl-coenzyme A synthetase [Aphelenchoides besseyi]
MSDKICKFNLTDDEEIYEPPSPLRAGAHLNSLPGYQSMYNRSVTDSKAFWLNAAKDLHFHELSSKGLEWNFDVRKGPIHTQFMSGSKTNVSYNCLERIIADGNGNRVAYYWEGNDVNDKKSVTYNQLHRLVVNFSAVLRSKGVKKGDVVAICLPMILELPVAMLACARIGSVHAVVFAGFSAESLAQRLIQANARILITADAFPRGPKIVSLKAVADEAVDLCREQHHIVKNVIVVEHISRVTLTDASKPKECNWNPEVDSRWDNEMEQCKDIDSPVEWMDAEDPLFILYTSGSTGVAKGIVHTTAGYMVYVYSTTRYVFDCRPQEDVFFCTADGGWITGHSYLVYGALLNGMQSILFEGVPTYPTADRIWSIVTKLYTAPTLVRMLMGFPEELVKAHDLSTLKVIGTVGEPINPAAWLWLYNVVGEKRAAIVDTYWQTETGGHMLTSLPAALPTKPGSAGLAFFGVVPVLVDNNGKEIEGPGEGNLCFAAPWPGISRSIAGDHERFEKTYFKSFPGYYFTGDGARRDEDGYYWITGRVDDLMNVSGHLLSTAEIESALTSHCDVVESAVVAAEHEIKGQVPYCFVVLRKQSYDTKIGPIATPEHIQSAPGLPKTRSGKITRRILRKITEGSNDLGDTSTLIDPSVINELYSRIPIRAG